MSYEINWRYILDHDEMQKVIDATGGNLRNRAIVSLIYDTGMRVSEMCDLNLGDLDLENNTIYIKNGKGSKPRVVFISTHTKVLIEDYIASKRPESHSQALFLSWKKHWQTGDHEGLDKDGVEKMIRRLGVKARLDENKRVSPHTIRHSFATQYYKNGGDLESLRMILGHANYNIIMKYVNLANADIQEKHKNCSPMNGVK